MSGHQILNNNKPIDISYEKLLKNLQGNIIKDHGRDFANHIFVTFTAGPQVAKKWIARLTDSNLKITSAWQQREDAAAYNANKQKNKAKPFLSFFLSAEGYRYLNIRDMPDEAQNANGGHSFKDGMITSGEALLNDPRNWDDRHWKRIRSRNAVIHAMILVANDSLKKLSADTKHLKSEIDKIAVCFVEKGRMYYQYGQNGKPDTSKPLEHFGSVDGISNPLFFKEDVDKRPEDFTPLKLVLTPDPGGVAGQPCYGSFMVFRKLEQNVADFKQRVEDLSKQLLPGGDVVARAHALVMGRFPNGTPITVHSHEVPTPPFQNNFQYLDNGGRCPLKAHIRRSNPRNDIPDSRDHRIVRRGMTYGRRKKDFSGPPPKNVGLLFMCYQSDIGSQFEEIQRAWCNYPPHRDPIIGLKSSTRSDEPIEKVYNQQWPRKWAQTQEEITRYVPDWLPDWPEKVLDKFHFGQYVTLKGGEYFFAPSIPCLKNL